MTEKPLNPYVDERLIHGKREHDYDYAQIVGVLNLLESAREYNLEGEVILHIIGEVRENPEVDLLEAAKRGYLEWVK